MTRGVHSWRVNFCEGGVANRRLRFPAGHLKITCALDARKLTRYNLRNPELHHERTRSSRSLKRE
jgi:hypothetical protein